MEKISVKQLAPSAKLTMEAEKNVQFLPHSPLVARLGLHNLSRLARTLAERSFSTTDLRFLRALDFDQLEMLEAELTNQGILKLRRRSSRTLAQQAFHEGNLWRWRAERFGVSGTALTFRVRLPQYVIERSREVLGMLEPDAALGAGALMTGRRGELDENAVSELQYLESFAAYLNGEYDSAQNRYQRGLNLVLRVVMSTSREETTSDSHGGITLHFPLDKQEFHQALRELRPAHPTA